MGFTDKILNKFDSAITKAVGEAVIKALPSFPTRENRDLATYSVKFLSKNNENYLFNIFNESVRGNNFAFMHENIAEIQFPIRYIAEKAISGEFVLKSFKGDDIVWSDTSKKDEKIGKYFEKLLVGKNNLSSLLYNHIINKLVNGNSYIYAHTNSAFSDRYYKYSDSFFCLPSASVTIDLDNTGTIFDVPIKSYTLQTLYGNQKIDPKNILHIKDGDSLLFKNDIDLICGKSRLLSCKTQITNICEVYKARYVIYNKRGMLGIVAMNKKDGDTTIMPTDKEKKELRDELNSLYGLDESKDIFAYSDSPLQYTPISASINDLQPFKECFVDACIIAGAFNVPSELIPREDHGTFSNLESAEATIYDSVVIPECKRFLELFSNFAGFKADGYYIDCDFSKNHALAHRKKDVEETRRIVSQRCKEEYEYGIITLNDWRAELGLERIDNPEYDKLKEGKNERLKEI